jgi:hypothetical protein
MILGWLFPANLTLAYLQICRKISICWFASRTICRIAGDNCSLQTITPLINARWITAERAMYEVTAPAVLLLAVEAEAHLLRLTRVSDEVLSKPEHERLLRAVG